VSDLLLRGGRPWGLDAPADVLIREGVIERIGPGLRADPAAEVVNVPGRLLLPGLIDAHCHVDKTLFGGRWVPHSAGPALADRIAEERRRQIARACGYAASVLSESFWLVQRISLPREVHHAYTQANAIDQGKPGRTAKGLRPA
jgi:cytosine/adenosine deaminase-related metal-dependent hydrolase